MGNWLLNRPEGLSQEGMLGLERPPTQILNSFPQSHPPSYPCPRDEQNQKNFDFIFPKLVNEPLEKVLESIPADSTEAVWSIRIESGIGD